MNQEEQIGDILIRLLADEVSMREVRLVLRHLRDNPALRERASTIGTLVEAEEEKRAIWCENMIEILFCWVDPITTGEVSPITDHQWFIRMGNKLLGERFLGPLLKSNKWYHHVKRAGTKLYTNKKNECYVSVELFEVVQALEDLWGMQKTYTVPSREMTTAEWERQAMNQELTARGSKLVKL
jgi:hypothetical protein